MNDLIITAFFQNGNAFFPVSLFLKVTVVTIHDRPEGSRLGTCNYVIEIENKSGLSDDVLSMINDIGEVEFRGSFCVKTIVQQ